MLLSTSGRRADDGDDLLVGAVGELEAAAAGRRRPQARPRPRHRADAARPRGGNGVRRARSCADAIVLLAEVEIVVEDRCRAAQAAFGAHSEPVATRWWQAQRWHWRGGRRIVGLSWSRRSRRAWSTSRSRSAGAGRQRRDQNTTPTHTHHTRSGRQRGCSQPAGADGQRSPRHAVRKQPDAQARRRWLRFPRRRDAKRAETARKLS